MTCPSLTRAVSFKFEVTMALLASILAPSPTSSFALQATIERGAQHLTALQRYTDMERTVQRQWAWLGSRSNTCEELQSSSRNGKTLAVKRSSRIV
jgi:hypothetical protein